MAKRLFAIGAVSLLVVAAALPVAAQTMQMNRLTANIPFEFTVAGKTMPAGEYEVVKRGTSPVIVLRGLDQPAVAAALATASPLQGINPETDSVLVFHRYGNQHFLHKVVNGYSLREHVLPETRAERELAGTAALHQEQVFAVLARR